MRTVCLPSRYSTPHSLHQFPPSPPSVPAARTLSLLVSFDCSRAKSWYIKHCRTVRQLVPIDALEGIGKDPAIFSLDGIQHPSRAEPLSKSSVLPQTLGNPSRGMQLAVSRRSCAVCLYRETDFFNRIDRCSRCGRDPGSWDMAHQGIGSALHTTLLLNRVARNYTMAGLAEENRNGWMSVPHVPA